MDIIFVDDEAIASMAGAYRGSPRPTDVLAFCYGDAPLCGVGDVPRAEVYVSVDTARRQARERGVPLSHELVLRACTAFSMWAGWTTRSPPRGGR